MGIMKLTKEQKDRIKEVKIAIQNSQKLNEQLYVTLTEILLLEGVIENDDLIKDRLYDYLECLPVQHLTVDKVEADTPP